MKQTIITILLTLVAMVGQAQTIPMATASGWQLAANSDRQCCTPPYNGRE